MKEQLTAYLEQIWTEYLDYKEFIKSIAKPVEELRKEVAQKITPQTTAYEAQQLFFNGFEKIMLHNGDFINQQNRLFYTVEAYKNSIEIPQEIKTEVENLKFLQIFAIKDGKETVINQEALDFTKKQIEDIIVGAGVDEFKRRFL